MTNETPSPETSSPSSSVVKRFIPLGIFVAAAIVAWRLGLYDYLSLRTLADSRETLRNYVDDAYPLAVLSYMAVYIVAVALSVPGALLLTISGGFLFGWMVGGVAAVVSAAVGASIIFLIAGTAFGESLSARAGPFIEKLRSGFQKDAYSYLLFLRLVPAFPFWLVNLAPALLGVRLRVFFFATLIGIAPGTFAFSFVGAGLDSIIDKQQEVYQACLARSAQSGETCVFAIDPASLVTPTILIAFAALGVVALLPIAIRKLSSRAPDADA